MRKILFLLLIICGQFLNAQTFTNSTVTTIPDNDAVVGGWSEITVSGINPISEVVSVQIDITHTYDSDLLIQLEFYSDVYTLSNGNGGSGDNYTSTVFTNTAGTSITLGAAPFNGAYIPENLLPTFAQNFNPNGVWRLHVYDLVSGDVGQINSWSITFSSPACPTVNFGDLPATMNCTDPDTLLFASDPTIAGGYDFPALFFEFNVDAAAEGNLTDNVVTIYEDGSPIYSGTVNTDRLTVYTTAPFMSPASAYTFTATDNDGTMTWLVYDENGTTYNGSFTNTTVTEGPWSPQGTSSWTCVPTNGITATGDWGAALFDPSTVPTGVSYTITYNWDNQGAGAHHCSGSASHSVSIVNPWDGSWTSPGSVCSNGGSLNLNSYVTGDAGGTWSGSGVSGSTFNPSGLSGSYSITYIVGTTTTCQSVVSHNINVVPAPTANAGSDATICEGSNYTLSGAATNYSSVSWSGGTGTFGNASALNTTYTPSSADIANGSVVLTLTANANSPCSNATSTMTLTINPQPTVDAGSNDAICANETYTLSGSATNYSSVTWSTPNNGSFDDASSLTAIYTPGSIDISSGSVVLTLTTNDPVGPCNAASSTMTLTINPLDDATFSYSSSTFCQSGTDPSPTVNTPGGTFTVSPAGLIINSSTGVIDLSASAINTYDVTYSTSGACPDVSTIQITVTLAPSADFTYSQADYCSDEPNPFPTFGAGASAGTFSASPSGLFFVSTATGEINLAATSPGTYTITNDIPASGGCASATHNESVSVYTAATTSAGQDAAICSYESYVLSGSTGGSATSNTWTTSGDGTFDDATSLTPTYTPGTTDISNGSVTLTITTDDPSGACGPATDDMVLTIHNAPVLTANVTDVTDCNNPDGIIDLHTIGGTDPLQFSIDNGSNFSSDSVFQNISGGIYQTMVVDNYSCMDTLSVFVGAPVPPVVDNTSVTDVLCYGDTTGNITITSSSASQFSIDNGITYQVSGNFTGLSAGNYQVVLQSAGGCLSDTNLVLIVNEPTAIIPTLTPTNPLCYGNCNGQMDLVVTGGTLPYTLVWSTGDNNIFTIDSLCDGTYNVTITDANGCTANAFEQISMPSEMNLTTNAYNVTCNGLSDGYITSVVTGGSTPYQYNWSDGNTYPSDSLISGGYYSVIVTDSNNCQIFEDSIYIDEPQVFAVSVVDTQNPYCTGNTDGSISVSVSGGIQPYTYIWNNGAVDSTISNLTSGMYSLTVIDANDCQSVTSVSLTGSDTLLITGDVQINEHYQGEINVTVSGGTPTYTYLWSNNSTENSISNLQSGDYFITVTDIHNCVAIDSFNVEIPLIIPTIITPNNDGYNDTWQITNIESYNDVLIEIYDRWGDMIFTFEGTGLEYSDTDNQWDGTYNGKTLPFTSYVYIVTLNHNKETYNGTVTIKR